MSLQLSKDSFPTEPVYRHPPFDLESRVVTAELGNLVIASMYVPNGGKDYPAKIAFLKRTIEWAGRLCRDGRELLICGSRATRSTCTRASGNPTGWARDRRSVPSLPGIAGHRTHRCRASDGPRQHRAVHLVAPWRNLRARNIGWRLDYMLALGDLFAQAQRCVVQSEVGTGDHARVVMEVTS